MTYNAAHGKWRSSIKVGGPRIHLGFFSSQTEAAEAYKTASLELHGEFSVFAREKVTR